MNITKSQSIFFGLAMITIFFVFSIFMFNRAATKKAVESAKVTQDGRPDFTTLKKSDFDSPLTLNNFHRSEIKDGKKVWEVTADKGKYFPETNNAVLENPDIYFFNDEKIVQLKAGKATLFLNGVSLERAELSVNVVLIYDAKITLETDNAIYDKASSTVYSPGFVKITSDTMEVTGNILNARLDQHQFTLMENVNTFIKAQNKRKK